MKKYLSIFSVIFLFSGCFENKTISYDGEKLLTKKCSSCHNLDMPPKTSPNEPAPPMMAVAFHLRDFLKAPSPSENREKFISFIQDYVINPSKEKSLCDKKSLESYGMMPSQKGKVTKEELRAIASYMYEHYDPSKFLKMMNERAEWKKMPLYKRVLKSKNCLSCHDIQKDKIAPSFVKIAQKYQNDKTQIIKSIKNGSRKKWQGFRGVMPPFDLNNKEANAIADWILSLKEKKVK